MNSQTEAKQVVQTHGGNGNGQAAPPQHEHHEDAVPTDLPKIGMGGALLIGIVLLVLLGALFFIGYRPHTKKIAEARHEAEEAAAFKPVVDVTRPKLSNAERELLLPGDVNADQTTAVFARTNGYLKPLPKGIDIGAKVKAGQLIAEISAPEVDAELEQARAALEQANVTVGRANNEYNFAKATYERYEGLSKTGGVTQQQLDEKRSAYNIANSSLKAAQANVLAATANVKRLSEQRGFQKVVAPFDGTITARNYDAGALISATNTGTGKELFRIEHTETLRVSVSVPQRYATDIKLDQPADLLVHNYPGEAFTGKVARTAGAIDQATRTMKVEVDVLNAQGRLFPGMYSQIRFKIQRERPAIILPTSAFVFGSEGMRVAVLEGNKVHYQPVVVGRDFGSEAEVASGLNADALVVTNPGEHLADGVEVRVNNALATSNPSHEATASTSRGGEAK